MYTVHSVKCFKDLIYIPLLLLYRIYRVGVIINYNKNGEFTCEIYIMNLLVFRKMAEVTPHCTFLRTALNYLCGGS